MRKNHLGKGLYAIAPIREGEVIYNATNSTTLVRVGKFCFGFRRLCNTLIFANPQTIIRFQDYDDLVS